MGGHGGLNILPQKRWNVYNFDNRERVRKDEEAAAREEEFRQQKARRAELEFKLGKLREIAQTKRRRLDAPGAGAALAEGAEDSIVARQASGDVENRNECSVVTAERPQFINLFAEFEESEKQELRKGHERNRDKKGEGREKGGREGSHKGVEKVDGKPTGEPINENYELGHGAVDKNGKKPWYAIKSFMVDRAQDVDRQPDSMLRITDGKNCNTTRTRKKKTIEELRAERLKREQEEKYKIQKLKGSKSGTGYERLPNGRMPQYHASFGNAR